MTNIQWVDTIADLKSLRGNAVGGVALVGGYWEPSDGGGGTFYWDAASTEAEVPGMIVQATGGSTGRWLRLHERGVYNVKWFGATGKNGVSVGGSPVTADNDAVQTALWFIEQLAFEDSNAPMHLSTHNSNGAVLYFPNGYYHLRQTVRLRRCITLRGNYQSGWAAGAYLKWVELAQNGDPDDVHGIVVMGEEYASSVPLSQRDPALTHNKGAHSVIEGFVVAGPGAPDTHWDNPDVDYFAKFPSGNRVSCGIVIYGSSVRVKDCHIVNWQLDAIHIDGNDAKNNANDWQIENIKVEACGRHGVFVMGLNSNAGTGRSISGAGPLGGYTIYDRSFLGNTYISCHSEGAAHSFYTASGGVANSTFVGCYQEASDGPATFSTSTTVIGGVWGNGITGTPTIAGLLPGEGAGIVRGIVRSPQAPPIRRWSPQEVTDFDTVFPAKDHTVVIDVSSRLGAVHFAKMQVPLPSISKGMQFTFKRVDTNTSAILPIVVGGVGTYKFEGVPNGTYGLKAGEGVTIQNDGVDWFVVSKF